MKTAKLNPTILSLAAKFDRLANEANFDESKHPRANDGKFTSGGGGSGGGSGGGEKVIVDDDINALTGGSLPELTPEQMDRGKAFSSLRKSNDFQSASAERKAQMLDTETKRVLRKSLYTSLERKVGTGAALELFRATGLSELDIHGDPAKVERAAHRAAILGGLKYNSKTRRYE